MKTDSIIDSRKNNQTVRLNLAYKALEKVKAEFINTQQKLFAAQAIYDDLYKSSDSFKIHRIRQWDNRGEDDV